MNVIFHEITAENDDVQDLVESFIKRFEPVEADAFFVLRDQRTGAAYSECHIAADRLLGVPMTVTASGNVDSWVGQWAQVHHLPSRDEGAAD